ncbi:MAG: hypothetical protein CR993_03550 [Rhodobacterales bacterium]|nr:MAG: hypothetical protein CR993_03550 [Rhodobacterales bacterium]
MRVLGTYLAGVASAVFMTVAALPALGEELTLPSGARALVLDVVDGRETGIGTVWFRYLYQHEPGVPTDHITDDARHLCETHALPQTTDDVPDHIVVVLTDAQIEFGQSDETVAQFFEVFRPDEGVCIWEAF